MTDWVVIPVAGRGTRMRPLTRAIPKEMLPLGRKPAIQWIVEELLAAGMRHLVFVTAPGKQAIEAHFADDGFRQSLIDQAAPPGIRGHRFLFVTQAEQRGLGDAVLAARPVVEADRFAVALGDCVLGAGRRSDALPRMARLQAEAETPIVIAFQSVPADQVDRFGIADPIETDRPTFGLRDVVEKPEPARAPSRYAIAGRYLLPASLLQTLASTAAGVGGELQLTDAIRQQIRQGDRAAGILLQPHEQRYDVGSFASYFDAFAAFAAADERADVEPIAANPPRR